MADCLRTINAGLVSLHLHVLLSPQFRATARHTKSSTYPEGSCKHQTDLNDRFLRPKPNSKVQLTEDICDNRVLRKLLFVFDRRI